MPPKSKKPADVDEAPEVAATKAAARKEAARKAAATKKANKAAQEAEEQAFVEKMSRERKSQ